MRGNEKLIQQHHSTQSCPKVPKRSTHHVDHSEEVLQRQKDTRRTEGHNHTFWSSTSTSSPLRSGYGRIPVWRCSWTGLLWNVQSMYDIPKRRWSTPSNPNKNSNMHRGFSSNRSFSYNPAFSSNHYMPMKRHCNCNCNSPDHLIAACEKRPHFIKNVNSILTQNPEKVKSILFELCKKTEESLTLQGD